MDIHIEKLDPSHFEDVKGIIENYPFHDYRRYKTVKVNKEYLYQQIQSFLPSPLAPHPLSLWERVGVRVGEGEVVSARVSGVLAGIISLRTLPWDSNLFGIKMGKIEHIIVSPLMEPSIQESVIKILLQQASIFAKENEIQHISVKADTDDHLLIMELQNAGFYIVDCLITYINEINIKPFGMPSLFNIREYQREDRERIIEIAREAYGNYIGRFNIDHYIPKSKGLDFYLEWTKNCCDGIEADVMMVAEKGGKVVGFLCFKANKILNDLSNKIKYMGRGLSAISKDGRGAYVSLVSEFIKHSVKTSTMIDYDTQINNFSVIRIWNKLGLSYVRSKHTFHKWFGE
ncbi:MAG: hypothetical protein HY097_01020 [Nitrospinae bacterium]|nr:hypothetical protein [Nitrospinota bacterium]MBI3813034.1 hypothetical protein [Nitrospinota bacterium]